MPIKKFEGEIVTTWQDATYAWIAMAVNEALPLGRMEYNANVLLTNRTDNGGNILPDFADLPTDEQLTLLIDAVKAVRDAQRGNDIQQLKLTTKVIAL